ncbi:MAG TPA: wax ester/triacylglycerol synthase domain-containing protein [Sporichthyaceae bacterium]|jgi:WS/DGAT/MGAT family acyltransferase
MTVITETGSGYDDLWSADPEMSDFEALMWRAEADARLRSDGTMMAILSHAPDWQDFRDLHAWAMHRVPRLRQKVVDDPLRIRPPAWVGTDVDLSYHVTRVRLSEDEGLDGLLDRAALLHMTPFDVARPLWQAVLVEGLPDGKAGYLLKLHHALSDGQGFMQLFDMLYPADPQTRRAAPRGPVPGIEDPASLGDDVRGSVHTVLGIMRGVGSMAARAVRRPTEAINYAQSLTRVVKVPGTPSRLLAQRGLARRMRVLECDIRELKAAGKAAGGSVNDAYIAALVGGVARYHAKHGAELEDFPLALPVSLRKVGDAAGGNKFAGAYIAAPATEPDPARRIQAVRERVLAIREEPAMAFLGSTAGVMSRLPAGVLTSVTLKSSSALNLQASNFPGLTRPSYLAGARIERMYPFGPVPGSAMMATLVTHDGIACIGVATDHDAVPDPDLLNECMREGLAEVLTLAKS